MPVGLDYYSLPPRMYDSRVILIRPLKSILKHLMFSLRSLFRLGIFGAFDELANRKLIWSVGEVLKPIQLDKVSSISESMPYLQICAWALENESVFQTFKSNTEYRAVLEHLDSAQGSEYLKLLISNSDEFSNLKFIGKRDQCSPQKFYFPRLGRISPTQIRYAKILQDIHLLFGSLDGYRIAEIGAGYGGQAIHILQSDSIAEYVIYDLESPGLLAQKYISRLPFSFKYAPVIGDFRLIRSADLVISNYAFSELTRENQEIYLKNVLQKSEKGYVIYNHIHEDPKVSMNVFEFAETIQDAEIFEEKPLTYPGNYLVVWGHSVNNLDENLFKRVTP